MALPAPQISDAAAVIGVRWPAMNPNTIAATTENPIATSNATTALIRPRALNISLESGMRRLTVQVKSGVRSQHFAFHSLNARTHSWICLQEPQPSGVRFAQFVARVYLLLENSQMVWNNHFYSSSCLRF